MHELGVLMEAMKAVDRVAARSRIPQVRHITLEVGEDSTYVPLFFHKLFPAAADGFPRLRGAELRTETVPGRGLVIKEIGY